MTFEEYWRSNPRDFIHPKIEAAAKINAKRHFEAGRRAAAEEHQREKHDWAIAHAEQLNSVIKATAEKCAEIVLTFNSHQEHKWLLEPIAAAIRERFKG